MSLPSRHRNSRAALVFLLGAPALCSAAALEVTVVDADGRPVSCVAVYAVPQAARGRPTPTAAAAAAERAPHIKAVAASMPAAPLDPHCSHAADGAAHAVMDQQHNAFVPHMLVVERGTAVVFPNSDAVSHHVYSFSDAKRFELALYKGDEHPPLVFDRAGVVVLGCNIHDGMLGYVVVVDTQYFATTDTAGRVVLHGLAPGTYSLDVFTPRLKDTPAPRSVAIADGAAVAPAEVRLEGRLAPPYGAAKDNLTWHRY